MTARPFVGATALLISTAVASAAPLYNIFNIGVNGVNDSGSQGNRVSSSGVATGRSLGSGQSTAFTWTQSGGRVALPNLASPARAFGVGNGVNSSGTVVGTGTTTAFGSSPLPVIWQSGVASQIPLPAGETSGRANSINNGGKIVGSVNGGSLERPFFSDGIASQRIDTTTPGGARGTTLFSINATGLAVGTGVDPANAARNVGFVYNTATSQASEVGALPGFNGALCFGVSDAGHIVGSSMLNQGSGLPFIYTDALGMQAIPLPAGTSQASARGANSSGWAVGTASGAFAIPFVYDGSQTYRLQDVIPAGTGWDLATNTSSSALSINDDGVIVGTGVFNGAVRAYAMVPVPEPTAFAAVLAATPLLMRRRK